MDTSFELDYTGPLSRLAERQGSRQGRHDDSVPLTQQKMTLKGITGAKCKEKEESYIGSLTERAVRTIQNEIYKKKLLDIKNNVSKYRYMDFVMDGVTLGMPYNGQKMTTGYLKKETKSLGIMLSKSWQPKYCAIDLTKFLFKYAKNPTEQFTQIHLKEIVDVVVEPDPEQRDGDKTIFSLGRGDKSRAGFNFIIQTPNREYRMQAGTKVEQMTWLRAFAVLFELRARILSNMTEALTSRSNYSKYSQSQASHRFQQSTQKSMPSSSKKNQSTAKTRNDVWERRLNMSKEDQERLPSKQTIEDIDEKMKRLTNDNFKLTMNSHREELKDSG